MKTPTRFNRLLAVVLLVLGAAALTRAWGEKAGAVVRLHESSLGRIIADSHGKTLYLSFVLTHRKGTYGYFCDPHAGFMHGSFRVV